MKPANISQHAKAKRILELAGSGAWQGHLGAMRSDRSRTTRSAAVVKLPEAKAANTKDR